MADPGEFLRRWSRLKRKAQAESGARSGKARPQTADAPPAGDAAASPAAAKPVDELPAIDTLSKDSDYTPFMHADVPDGLRNQALRKLWQSDPVFANLDGLLDYDEDFGVGFALGGAVATVYRVLEGMPQPTDEKQPEQREERPAEAPAAVGDSPTAGLDVAERPPASQACEQKPDVGPDEDIETEKDVGLN